MCIREVISINKKKGKIEKKNPEQDIVCTRRLDQRAAARRVIAPPGEASRGELPDIASERYPEAAGGNRGYFNR